MIERGEVAIRRREAKNASLYTSGLIMGGGVHGEIKGGDDRIWEYLETLEDELVAMKERNEQLEAENGRLDSEVRRVDDELVQLKLVFEEVQAAMIKEKAAQEIYSDWQKKMIQEEQEAYQKTLKEIEDIWDQAKIHDPPIYNPPKKKSWWP